MVVQVHHRRPHRLLLPAAVAVALALAGCSAADGEGTGTAGGEDTTGATATASAGTGSGAPSGSGNAGKDGANDDAGTDGSGGDQGDGAAEAAETHPEFPASNTTGLEPLTTITDADITPKSVVSNDHGLMITNNMMYRHDVTLFDTRTREVVQSLPDTVDADEWELEGLSGEVSGAPVEAVWTEDGQHAYVSQYQVTGHGAEAEDFCRAGEAITPSMVYRYSVEEQDWDQVIRVGRVPKYVALTPDETKLLVTNWCDDSLSVVDTETGQEERQIPLNDMPRGIAALPDNRTAYVTAMFAHELYRVDLESGESELVMQTGDRPRHLALSPDAEHLYLVVTGADQLLKLDAQTAEVVDSVTTRDEPRTMEISEDGTALYVVNYHESTVSKYDAETLEELDRQPAGYHPIGVTHDAPTGQVWVANYGGTINVYDDTDGAAAPE